MTSYRKPDYDIQLRISFENFQRLAGTDFSAQFTLAGEQRATSGMLIIPQYQTESVNVGEVSQIQDCSEHSIFVKAWVWQNDYFYMAEGAKLYITLGEPCDLMCNLIFDLETYTALAKNAGLEFEGVVIKNWNLEA